MNGISIMNVAKIVSVASILALGACANNNPLFGLSSDECPAAGGEMKEVGSGHFSGATHLVCVEKNRTVQSF